MFANTVCSLTTRRSGLCRPQRVLCGEFLTTKRIKLSKFIEYNKKSVNQWIMFHFKPFLFASVHITNVVGLSLDVNRVQ